MARKVLFKKGYTFTPSTKTVTIPEAVPQERLLLITNTSTGQVIYNFSDPSLKATAYTVAVAGATPITTITLSYNTTGMSSTDKLQFTYEVDNETIEPGETLKDPTNKLRVSMGESLIDTDFEYGTQITKWENLSMINNRPFAYPSATTIANISAITMSTGSRTVTITKSTGTFPANGTPIYVQDTYLSVANGNFIIETGGGTATATYTARTVNSTTVTNLLDPNKTSIFEGTLYASARLGGTVTLAYSGRTITVTTSLPHGLSIGNEIVISGITATTNAPNGTFTVATIESPTVFKYYTLVAPTGTLGGTITLANVPQGQALHRPFDGGVIFTTNGTSNYEQMVRQTRRYFRYQSGKGIQISSGTIIKAALQLESITSNGVIVTVQTKEKHNIQPGTSVTINGCDDPAYNGTFTITSVTGFNTFQYTVTTAPASPLASGDYYASVNSWIGARARLGAFDDQNGIFFEFDGQTLYAVRRSSTFQIAGRSSITNGSNTVTQTNASFPTYYARQLSVGDYIVIRGQSYKVQDIASDTSLTISPAYRGATTAMATISKTSDLRIPQSQWNLDTLDGNGPSGYNLDLRKMQMFYMDYTWYGAGFIRFGFRANNGDVIYCHKIANNNVNNEAYMRSGNLPARYETTTFPPITQTSALVGSLDQSISVESAVEFPNSGTLCIRSGTDYEYVNYTGKTATSFTGVTRALAGSTTAQSVTVAAGSNVLVVASTALLQVGMRVVSSAIPEGTFISAINVNTNEVTMTQAASTANPTDVIFPPMGKTAVAFPYSESTPVAVEYAYPTFAPTISHWGTSVIMDGGYDDDSSLIFTYGQTGNGISINAGASKALFSIRVAPSIDNGIPAPFGARELVNRMQLKLLGLGVTTRNSGTNYLVRAYLNGKPSAAVNWTVPNILEPGTSNSSLAQIADYTSNGNVTISGGEITGGFLSTGTDSLNLEKLRDLGNSILGGGGSTSDTGIFPDGPDTLTIVVTNLSGSTASFSGRISWTEAQA